MKLLLTDKKTGAELVVESDLVMSFEPANDGSGVGTHVIFSDTIGRNVNESQASIAALTGVLIPQPAPAGTTVKKLGSIKHK